jgi:preprotein translocase subunit SecD
VKAVFCRTGGHTAGAEISDTRGPIFMNPNRLYTYLTLALLLVALACAAVLYGLAVTPPHERKAAEASAPAFAWTLSSSYLLDVKLAADFSGLPPAAKPAEDLERSLKVFAVRSLQILHAVRPKIWSQDQRFIHVRAPGIKNPEQAVKYLIQSGSMEMKLVDETRLLAEFVDFKGNLLPEKLPPELEVLSDPTGERTILERRSLLPENCVEYAVAMKNQSGQPAVGFKLNVAGTQVFKELTSRYQGHKLAVVFNGIIYTVAKVTDTIANGQVVIDGSFSREEAEDLAQSLQAGTLPFPVRVVEQHAVLISPLQSLMALLGIHARSLLARLTLVLAVLSLMGAGALLAYPLLKKTTA